MSAEHRHGEDAGPPAAALVEDVETALAGDTQVESEHGGEEAIEPPPPIDAGHAPEALIMNIEESPELPAPNQDDDAVDAGGPPDLLPDVGVDEESSEEGHDGRNGDHC